MRVLTVKVFLTEEEKTRAFSRRAREALFDAFSKGKVEPTNELYITVGKLIEVLTPESLKVLKALRRTGPCTLAELEKVCSVENLPQTLETLLKSGFVEERKGKYRVHYDTIRIQLNAEIPLKEEQE